MNQIEAYAIEIVENITKEGMSITHAGVSTFFKAHGGDLIIHAKDTYFNRRFKIRLEEFSHEEQKLDNDTRKQFYENIDYKQLNYLFELFDKARTSTFDIHAKILAKIYSNLLSTGKLHYYEVDLVSHINTFHEDDFELLFTILDKYFLEPENAPHNYYGASLTHVVNISSDGIAIDKFINLGIFLKHEEVSGLDMEKIYNKYIIPKKMYFFLGEYSKELFHILQEVYSK